MKWTYSQGDLWRSTSGPVARPNAQNLFDNQRYTGGVLALFALREKVGEDAFRRLERTLLERYRNGVVSTENFISLAAETSGDASARPFLEDWLYETLTPPMPNHPDWTVNPVTGLAPSLSDLQHDRRDLSG